jgi:hypothetical protein
MRNYTKNFGLVASSDKVMGHRGYPSYNICIGHPAIASDSEPCLNERLDKAY